MQPYSLDIRKRIVKAVKNGQRIKDVAERFEVSRWTVRRYVKLDEADKLKPNKHPGQAKRLGADELRLLAQQVKDHPDWTLEKRAAELSAQTDSELKKSALGNYLKGLGVTHKKKLHPQ